MILRNPWPIIQQHSNDCERKKSARDTKLSIAFELKPKWNTSIYLYMYTVHMAHHVYICKSHDISSDIIDVIWHFIHKSVMRATDIVYIFGVYYIDIRRI